jgi:chorismate mutase/prephenate dehydratase
MTTTPSDRLQALREALDATDARLLDALSERQRLVAATAALKGESALELRDLDREDRLVARLQQLAAERELDPAFVSELFRAIVDHSVRRQTAHLLGLGNPGRVVDRATVAYQGSAGAWSHIAARRHFGSQVRDLECVGFPTFAEAARAVEEGRATAAILPIENTTAGSINDVYDLLVDRPLSIIGEEALRVDHCLIGLEERPLEALTRVSSHPQALAQCSRFLQSLPWVRVEAWADTAMAVARVREEGDPSLAALASEEAATIHGLVVIRRGITDQKDNFTRFVVVARDTVVVDPRIAAKTSLVFATTHERGALVDCLNVLAAHGLSLTKIQSRPRPDDPWQYLFAVDFLGNRESPEVRRALDRLRARTRFLKVLGTYPAVVGV